MKTFAIAAILATLTLSGVAPVQAATVAPGAKALLSQTEIDRRGRGCDTAHDIAEKPRCRR